MQREHDIFRELYMVQSGCSRRDPGSGQRWTGHIMGASEVLRSLDFVLRVVEKHSWLQELGNLLVSRA